MNHNAQLNAILIFEYAFNLLELEMNKGSQSIGVREKVLEIINPLPEKLKNPTIEQLLSQVPIINKNEKLMVSQFVPATMILSFCNELAIKTLIYQTRDINQRGHKLSTLLSKLNKTDSNQIKNDIMTELNLSEVDFETQLATNDNGFTNWRYFYEGGPSANLLFLKSMFQSVKNKIVWK